MNRLPKLFTNPRINLLTNNFAQRFVGYSSAIRDIESFANRNQNNAEFQSLLLKTLNRNNQYQAVIRRYNDPHFAQNADTYSEYLYAMSKLGRRIPSNFFPKVNTPHNNSTFAQFPIQDQYQPSFVNNASNIPQNFPYSNANVAGGFNKSNITPIPANIMANTPQNISTIPHLESAVTSDQKVEGAKQDQKNNGNQKDDAKGTSSPIIRVQLEGQNTLFSKAQKILHITLIAAFIYIVYKGLNKEGLLGLESKTKLVNPEEVNVTFDDVKGIDEARQELEDIVMYLRDPQKFTDMGAKIPKGVLLTGEPGTGKTLLARAIAGEADVPFFSVSGSEFDEVFVGLGSKRVRDLFREAKKNSPCIVFIDEIDSLGSKRKDYGNSSSKSTLNQLLTELDGFETDTGVILIGATNLLSNLDPALIRPGRFDKIVNVPLPDIKGRKQIIDLYLAKIPKAVDVSSERLARSTPGMTGADLFNVINSAAIKAAKLGKTKVTMKLLEEAFDDVSMGVERRSVVIPPECRKLTAYHEAGHATVSFFTDGTNPIRKATIVSRGQSLGMVASMLKEKDMFSISKKELLAKIATAMGGRAGEEILLGKEGSTTGASSDFQQATSIATKMVTQWGMSEKVGHVLIEDRKDLSIETKAMIDSEIHKILNDQVERAKSVLLEHHDVFCNLADALLEHETLTGEEITQILKGEKFVKVKELPQFNNNKANNGKVATYLNKSEDDAEM